MEENLRRALLISRGDWTVFLTRPLSAVLMATAAFLLVLALLPSLRKKRDEVFVESERLTCVGCAASAVACDFRRPPMMVNDNAGLVGRHFCQRTAGVDRMKSYARMLAGGGLAALVGARRDCRARPGSSLSRHASITMIVPFAAGGPTDVISRIVTGHMAPTLGQSIIIENVVGAGGTTAHRARRAPPMTAIR